MCTVRYVGNLDNRDFWLYTACLPSEGEFFSNLVSRDCKNVG